MEQLQAAELLWVVEQLYLWLLQDQVNSTTITANADGSFASGVKYSAFGEIRSANGVTVTDNKYTGQRNEVEIGLDYYVARFYDPAIAHFVQADSMIPQAGSLKGYDRYSYVANNPIKYNDPSGHWYCEEAGNCNSRKTLTSSEITKMISNEFSWRVEGDLNRYDLGSIYGAGSTIRGYVDRNITGNGGNWIKKNLGFTLFEKNKDTKGQAQSLNASAFVWPYNTVRLGSASVDSRTLVHELGHVLDNNQKGGSIPATVFGKGPADDMVSSMRGNPEKNLLRMQYGNIKVSLQSFSIDIVPNHKAYIDNIAGVSPWQEADYANNGISDDFAQTFRYTITGERSEAALRVSWMSTYLASLPN